MRTISCSASPQTHSRWRGISSASARHRARVGVATERPIQLPAGGRSRECECAASGSASFGPEGVGKVSFSSPSSSSSGSVLKRLRAFLGKGRGLDRKKIASLGASVLLSYGFVSNVNACTLFTISWIICGRTTGLSPLAAGNWKAFLGIYGGLYLSFGNLLRPVRASLAIVISPLFTNFIKFLQTRFNLKRPVAFGLCVFLVNFLGSIAYFALAITTACFVFKQPLLP